MIRGIGVLRISTYSQTLNVQEWDSCLVGRVSKPELRHQVGLLREAEQAMRNEPLRAMWRQNFWAYSRYVKRVLMDMDSWTVGMEVGTR